MAEALSIGASIIACVQATKTIYKVVSDIGDGPENVKRAAADAQGLMTILEHLSRLQLLDEDSSESLKARLLLCVDDLERFEKKLGKVAITDSERRLGRCWKRIRAFLDEKYLETISSVITGHIAALNLHINALQRFVSSFTGYWIFLTIEIAMGS